MAMPRRLRSPMMANRRSTSSRERALVGSSITRMEGLFPSTFAISTSWASCWLMSSMGRFGSRSRPTESRSSRAWCARAALVEEGAAARETPGEEVLRDADGPREAELLVDHADAVTSWRAWGNGGGRHGLPITISPV